MPVNWPCRRPTFLPAMKLRSQRGRPLDTRRASLLAYLTGLADLALPKKALPALGDLPRLAAYEAGIRAALAGLAELGEGQGGGKQILGLRTPAMHLPCFPVSSWNWAVRVQSRLANRRASALSRPGARAGARRRRRSGAASCARRRGHRDGRGAQPHAVPHGKAGDLLCNRLEA